MPRISVTAGIRRQGPGASLPTYVVQINTGQEVLRAVRDEVDRLDLGSAVISLIGAVDEAEISVMAKDDDDHIRRYSQPMGLTGTG
jgi:predicted DNA-binding protein with PD1-like motif